MTHVPLWTQNQGGEKRKGNYFFSETKNLLLGALCLRRPQDYDFACVVEGFEPSAQDHDLEQRAACWWGQGGGCDVWSHRTHTPGGTGGCEEYLVGRALSCPEHRPGRAQCTKALT